MPKEPDEILVPIINQMKIDEVRTARPDVATLANCIGFALALRNVKFTTDDAIAAAERAVDQGWKLDTNPVS